MRLYLAHPLLSRKWVRRAELNAEKQLGIELINPFYDEIEGIELPAHILSEGETNIIKMLDEGKLSWVEYNKKLNPDIIVTCDLKKIDIADGIVGVIPSSKMIGTICELTYAKLNDELVFCIIYDKKLRGHPWLEWVSDGKTFKHFREWKKWMKENYSDLHSTKH